MYTSAYLIIQEHAVNSRSTAIDFGTSCSSESTIVHIALGKMLENVHFTIAKLPRGRVVKGLAYYIRHSHLPRPPSLTSLPQEKQSPTTV
jgi:hypothetical protein